MCDKEECESEYLITPRTCEKCLPAVRKRHAEEENRPGYTKAELAAIPQSFPPAATNPDAPVARREGILHSHTCTVGSHDWEHDDVACALQEIIYLECPECMEATKSCPQCGADSIEMPGLARSEYEFAYWCQPCNLVFRYDPHHVLVL